MKAGRERDGVKERGRGRVREREREGRRERERESLLYPPCLALSSV